MFTFSLITAALLTTTHAFNDWSQPCTTGSCSYDIASDANTIPASMSLNGPNQVLSDITPAAGWRILDCNPNWSNGSHAIRMVCTGTAEQIANCDHLDANGGASHTVVRLPESCGTGPFAHVNSTFTPTNQSTPFNLTRRDGSSSNVRGLVLDYDFENIPPSRGTLNFSLVSSPNGSPIPVQKRSRSRIHMPRAVAVAAPAANTPQTLISKTIPLKLANQSFSLVDTSIDCSSAQGKLAGKAGLQISAVAGMDAALVFEFAVAGSVVPLKVNSFTMSSTLTGQASATFHVASQAQGSFDSGPLTLFKAGLPGLSVPGLITLGPSLVVTGATGLGQVEFETALSMTSAVKFPSLKFNFPPGSKKTPESVQPLLEPNTFQLSASNATADFNGSVTGHITPSLNFGLSLGSSTAGANLFVNMDMSATAGLTFKAAKDVVPILQVPAAGSAAAKKPSAVARRATSGVNGCVDVSAGLTIEAGLTGSLPIPGLSGSQKFPLASASLPLFKKCIGTEANGVSPAAAARVPTAPTARSISGGSTIARIARSNSKVAKPVPTSPSKISPAKPASPGVASGTASGTITQPSLTASGELINQLKPQTSTGKTTQLNCHTLSLPAGSLPRII